MSQSVEHLIEDFANTTNDILDNSLIGEEIILIDNVIIDLNEADFLELTLLNSLSEKQILALIEHRKSYGKIADIEELQVIEGFTAHLIKVIDEKVVIKSGETWKNYNSIDKAHETEIRIRSSRVLEKSRAYSIEGDNTEARYLGSPEQLYLNIRYQYLNRLSLGVTAEKDAGESFFSNSQKRGFDFYSSFIEINLNSTLQKIIIGDYQVHFGQGLCFSTFSMSGKTSEVLLVERNMKNVRPSNSVNEYNFLRGIVAVSQFGPLTLSTFYSNRNHDASTVANGVKEEVSIQRSGLHRTSAEMANKNKTSSQVIGMNLTGDLNSFHPGFTIFKQQYSHSVRRNTSRYILSEKNSIQDLVNLSFNYDWDIRNFHFYGELAHSFLHGQASINGLLLAIDPRLNLNVTYRNYGRNYQYYFSSAFSENTSISNEKGLYTSLHFRPNRRISLSYFNDYFQFPWLKYGVNAPSSGADHFLELKYRPKKIIKFSLRLRLKEKQVNDTESEAAISKLTNTSKRQIRLEYSHQLNQNVRFRTRFEKVLVSAGIDRDKGFMTFQELKFKSLNSPISVLLRYSIFDTDNYNSRIYAFEQDLPGSYSIPAMYGNGSRYMLLFTYKVSRELQFHLKFSQSIFEDQTSIGNSWDRINGSMKSEIKLMCRIRM